MYGCIKEESFGEVKFGIEINGSIWMVGIYSIGR